MRQDFVHQQGCTARHSARVITGAKAAFFAAKSDQFFFMAGIAFDPEETMLKSPALRYSSNSLVMYFGKYFPWLANSA